MVTAPSQRPVGASGRLALCTLLFTRRRGNGQFKVGLEYIYSYSRSSYDLVTDSVAPRLRKRGGEE